MIHMGNAIIDGRGGWFFGNHQFGQRFHSDVFMKYGLHHTGEECRQPYAPSAKMNMSILLEGGPFVHSFKDQAGNQLDDVWLEKVSDYVIYGPDVMHTWKAVKESTVLTVQFPPSAP